MPAIWIPKRLVEIGLINSAAENPSSFVCHCEIEYESRVIAAAAESKSGNAKIIMLTGPSASGKTTTAHKLCQSIKRGGTNAVVVSLDDFYVNMDSYPLLPDGSVDYESVHALDIDEIHSCLLQLVEKGRASLPQFDFEIEKRKPQRQEISLQNGVAIVEGIHALNPLLTDALPKDSVYKIYAGLREEYSFGGQRSLATKDIRLARRMVRDFKFRGHSLEKTLCMWPKVCQGEDTYIKNYKSYADLLLDTSFSYEICVLAGFIAQMPGTVQNPEMEKTLQSLAGRFAKCNKMKADYIPPQSMLREFIGN